jgi:hypothetical protein
MKEGIGSWLGAVDLMAAYGGPREGPDEREDNRDEVFSRTRLFSRSSEPSRPAKPGSQIDGAHEHLVLAVLAFGS